MPIIKSAKKRVKTANKAAVRNSKTKRTLKTALKSFQTALKSGDKTIVKKQSALQSNIDKAAKKNIIHKNKANRLKQRAAQKAKTVSLAKPATKTKTPAKKVTKK